MFYIVESEEQIERLKSYGINKGYVEVISNNDNLHPKLSTTVALYIRPLNLNKGFISCFLHAMYSFSKGLLTSCIREASTPP